VLVCGTNINWTQLEELHINVKKLITMIVTILLRNIDLVSKNNKKKVAEIWADTCKYEVDQHAKESRRVL
jgi:hypothetical protein